jgi:VanZ family protein
VNATLPLVEDPSARRTTLLSKRPVAAWLPALVWAGLIFAFSAQEDLTFFPDQSLDFVVRKLGHMVIFGVLAILLWRALAGTTTLRRPWAWALALTILYAITDELHQAFVPGRTASGQDVGIDGAGALIAVAIVGFVGARWLRRHVRP